MTGLWTVGETDGERLDCKITTVINPECQFNHVRWLVVIGRYWQSCFRHGYLDVHPQCASKLTNHACHVTSYEHAVMLTSTFEWSYDVSNEHLPANIHRPGLVSNASADQPMFQPRNAWSRQNWMCQGSPEGDARCNFLGVVRVNHRDQPL